MIGNNLISTDNKISDMVKQALTQPEVGIIQLVYESAIEKGMGLYSGNRVFISFERYSEVLGLPADENTYKQMLSAVEALFENSIKYVDDCKNTSQSRIISGYGTYAEKGGFDISLCSPVIDPIMNNKDMKDIFSSKLLSHQALMTNDFSKLLYEILVRWIGIGYTHRMELGAIKDALNINSYHYWDMDAFSVDILDVAINEIALNTDYEVSYQTSESNHDQQWVSFSIKQKSNYDQFVITGN